jgi:hypothetical protein
VIDRLDSLRLLAEMTLIVRIRKKWPGREADHTVSYGAEINAWSHNTSAVVHYVPWFM